MIHHAIENDGQSTCSSSDIDCTRSNTEAEEHGASTNDMDEQGASTNNVDDGASANNVDDVDKHGASTNDVDDGASANNVDDGASANDVDDGVSANNVDDVDKHGASTNDVDEHIQSKDESANAQMEKERTPDHSVLLDKVLEDGEGKRASYKAVIEFPTALESATTSANSVDEHTRGENECVNAHMEKDRPTDNSASLKEVQGDREGKNTSSEAAVDFPMSSESVTMEKQIETNERSLSKTVADTAATGMSVACSDAGGGSRAVECGRREGMRDRQWVIEAAAILKQLGCGSEWTNIVDTWVELQRYWESIEVSVSNQTDQILIS